MIHTYIINNYLNINPTALNSEFNKDIKEFLTKKKTELVLKGVFYTLYSKTDDYGNHIKIGFFSENKIEEIDKLKNEIRFLLNSILEKQGDMVEGTLYLPNKANELTGFIACYSFELLSFIENKNNEQISDLYQAIITWCVKNIRELNKIILEKFPYILTINLSLKENSKLNSFCSNLKRDILDNAEDLQMNFWFIMERLFHHCNNSNKKFGSEENEIFNKLISKINSR